MRLGSWQKVIPTTISKCGVYMKRKNEAGLAHLELPNQDSLLPGSHWNAESLNNQNICL
jgi:hypothetical protein